MILFVKCFKICNCNNKLFIYITYKKFKEIHGNEIILGCGYLYEGQKIT